MSQGKFVQGNRTIQPKWLVKNENTLRFDLSIQRNEVWDKDRKSMYIRSMIYGYPVGSFHAQDNSDDQLWMLDGKQRFTTIIKYLKGEFELSENTPPINGIKIAGCKYEDLSEDFKDEIRTRNLTLFTYKNMDETERDELFLCLNNGMSLSKMELTRVIASSKIMNFINEISDHELFQNTVAISDNQRNHYVDEEIILQVLSVLINGYEKGLGSKEMKEFAIKLRESGIQDNIREVMKETTNYIYQAISAKERFMKKVHIPVIFNVAVKAINDGIEPVKFGGFLQWFFDKNNIPYQYKDATTEKSASKENVKVRIEQLFKAYEENINTAPNYQKPEDKSVGKRGRKLGSKNKDKTIDSNPPANPLSLVAAGNPS